MNSQAVNTSSNREIRERLSRCVSTMVFYQADGWSWSGAQLLFEEAKSLRAWASMNGPDEKLDTLILAPLAKELEVRYGDTQGAKLHREFLRALKAMTESPSDD